MSTTVEELRKEKILLEKQVDLAVRQFISRCGLDDWQVRVTWGQMEISTQIGDGPPSNARTIFMASVAVTV